MTLRYLAGALPGGRHQGAEAPLLHRINPMISDFV